MLTVPLGKWQFVFGFRRKPLVVQWAAFRPAQYWCFPPEWTDVTRVWTAWPPEGGK